MTRSVLDQMPSEVNLALGSKSLSAQSAAQILSRRTFVPPDRPVRPSIDGGRLVAVASCLSRILQGSNQCCQSARLSLARCAGSLHVALWDWLNNYQGVTNASYLQPCQSINQPDLA